MAWLSTTIDCGEFGQRHVDVEYSQSHGCISIQGISLGGTDMIMYADDQLIDSLRDEIKARDQEERECAAAVRWETRRDMERCEAMA